MTQQQFLARIVMTAMFVALIITLYVTFFSGIFKPTCSSNQEFLMMQLVNDATNFRNPTSSVIKQFKILDCTKEILLYSDGYVINYKNGDSFDSDTKFYKGVGENNFPVNIDALCIEGCNAAKLSGSGCVLPEESGEDTYKVSISPLNLKFLSSSDEC